MLEWIGADGMTNLGLAVRNSEFSIMPWVFCYSFNECTEVAISFLCGHMGDLGSVAVECVSCFEIEKDGKIPLFGKKPYLCKLIVL